MNTNRILFYFLLLTSHFSLLSAQVIFVPINDNIYNYLDRMNIKGIIQLDSEVKPFSRVYIAEKLIEITDSKILSKNLTNVDLELLDFYSAEYGMEIERLQNHKIRNDLYNHSPARLLSEAETTFASKDPFGRIRLLSYDDSLFSLKLSPIAAYSISNNGSKSGRKRAGGVRLFITVSDWLGGSIDMRDSGEFGENIDREKYLTPQRGADFIGAPDGIEFSDVRTQINFNGSSYRK